MTDFDLSKLIPLAKAMHNAAKIVAREHAKAVTDDKDLLSMAGLYPTFDDFLQSGRKIEAAETPVIVDGVDEKGRPILYKVAVDTVPDKIKRPGNIATNFVRINNPGNSDEYLPWEKASWASGARVVHKDRYWISDIDSNTREPGTPDCNWTEVKPEQAEVKPEIPPKPDYPPIDQNVKNSNGTVKWADWRPSANMTDYYNAGDGVTHGGVRKVSLEDFNGKEPVATASTWRDATPEDY